ncbi:hypothetical protein TNCT_218351 [Trichonephila clavata]|uniref:Uncharacterized protein n=1 Tax=Trichonephila clavata TaxID=2740835 RepID=A0A8X6IDX7_TRICU|nr:hypothetical protein TNCT_218351 [Trichonephila clavata]
MSSDVVILEVTMIQPVKLLMLSKRIVVLKSAVGAGVELTMNPYHEEHPQTITPVPLNLTAGKIHSDKSLSLDIRQIYLEKDFSLGIF